MSVPRAKKKKKQKDPAANPNNWQSRRITEAIRMCVAEAVWDGYNYYGYRQKRIERIPKLFWDEMSKAHDRNATSKREARIAAAYIDVDIIRECGFIMDLYIRDCYILCVSVMVQTLKLLKWSRKRLNVYVKLVLASVKDNDVYRFIAEVAKATGYNAVKEIVWS